MCVCVTCVCDVMRAGWRDGVVVLGGFGHERERDGEKERESDCVVVGRHILDLPDNAAQGTHTKYRPVTHHPWSPTRDAVMEGVVQAIKQATGLGH